MKERLVAGGADSTENLAGCYRCSDGDIGCFEVGVDRTVSVAVLDDDDRGIAGQPGDERDFTRLYRAYRGSSCRRDVDAGVESDSTGCLVAYAAVAAHDSASRYRPGEAQRAVGAAGGG